MARLEVEALEIADVKIIRPAKFGDHRGFFSETYNSSAFADAGVAATFVQDNHSLSAKAGTLRGLHYQSAPFAQDKLVRVVRGRIWDVAVDIRKSSPTFGRWAGAEISADAWNQIYVPAGFAHGFVTLSDDTEVIYKVSALYAPGHEHGIAWDDPTIGITWPADTANLTLSDKDKLNPPLSEAAGLFD